MQCVFPPAEVSSFRSSHRFAVNRRQPGFACVGNRATRPRSCDRKCLKCKQLVIHVGHSFILLQLCPDRVNNKATLTCSSRIFAVVWIHRQMHDAERHLALRLLFQPKGLKHLIPAAHSFYTIRGNSSCYHSVLSEC